MRWRVSFWKMVAMLGVLVAMDGAFAQVHRFGLPSPASSLGPVREPDQRSLLRAAADQALDEQLPPPLDRLPTARIVPNAAGSFSPQRRMAQLVRGNSVLEISNQALRNSGLYEKAISSSPQLARSFQIFESRTLQRQQVEFQSQLMRQNVAAGNADVIEQAESAAQAAQQIAAEQFEEELWNIGFNGAKVARVTNPNFRDTNQHVLIDSIANSPSNNLGYSITRVLRNGDLGATTVPSEFLLPLPADANDLFFHQLDTSSQQRTPDGLMIMMYEERSMNPIVQLLAAPRFGLFHDTGFDQGNGALNFVENIALTSRRASPAGQTFFFQEGNNTTTPLDLGFNTQVLDVGGGQSLQFFLSANNDVDQSELDVETLGFRTYNRRVGSLFEGWSLALGTQQSLFGEIVLRPHGLSNNQRLVGTVDRSTRRRPQLAVHAPLTNYATWKLALEEPHTDDVFFSQPVTQLTRWPTFATNVTLFDLTRSNQLHLGAIMRSVGLENVATGQERFATGWGLSAIAKFASGTSITFMGVAGGNGVGDYIQGVTFSSVADAGSISTLSGMGAFVGRQTVWRNCNNAPSAELNLAYGYSLMDNPAILGGTANRRLHHGWVNYTRFLNDQIGVGAEYQYGNRQIGNGDVGENHRFLFIVAIRSAATEASTRINTFTEPQLAASQPTTVTGADGLFEEFGPPGQVVEDAPLIGATFLSESMIGGRPATDVIGQTQLGGAAHLQGL